MSLVPLAPADVVAAVGEQLGRAVRPDGWGPAVQGAVGQVTGLTDGDERYVLKLFPAAAALRARTEAVALGLAATTGAPVPGLVLDGMDHSTGVRFLLTERLPGRRWSDRRPELDSEDRAVVEAQAARLLRQLHGLQGRRFGSIVGGEPSWDSAWASVVAQADAAMTGYQAAGGLPGMCAGVRTLLHCSRELYAVPFPPSFCHHDLNGGNVLMTASGPPRLTGLVDLERASWDDPMRDLALTSLHVRYHDPDAVAGLVAAYGDGRKQGGLGDGELARLNLHQVLLAMRERTWIVTDRPAQWRRSAAALDRLLAKRLAVRP